ncbi:ribonuclease T2 [Frigidibacter sp. MR17.24]|uniref:ribonuclease T2 n=1 Tax=Frigidibacter sp. MR17.24 TaxID=3127345 RepID=UPI003012E5D9
MQPKAAARLALAALALLAAPAPATRAEGEAAGAFDYYLLALSWSPSFCALGGDDGDAAECRPGARRGFLLHGLWPQNERGWPSYCRTPARDPSRAESARMADVMGSGGLAWYEWKKHGRCSGLSAQDYFATARAALARVAIPPVLTGLPREVDLPASVVEDAFLDANPALAADGITVTCERGLIREVRICLTRDLSFRRCGADTIRDCRLPDARMPPPR